MRIKFWGVRGSIATPGESTVRYGGNTACIEVTSGRREFNYPGRWNRNPESGKRIDQTQARRYVRIFSLLIPIGTTFRGSRFLNRLSSPGNELTIVGPEARDVKLAKLIAEQMNKIYFPVTLSELEAKINFVP